MFQWCREYVLLMERKEDDKNLLNSMGVTFGYLSPDTTLQSWIELSEVIMCSLNVTESNQSHLI